MPKYSILIKGIGAYAPERVVTNHDLSQIVDTSDEWIQTRTGIRERHIAPPEQATSDIALIACQRAIENAGMKPEDIDLLIVGTISPDYICPSTACILQAKLGLRNIACLDINAACSGFIYGLNVATNMLRGGIYRTALIVGAEKMTNLVDWTDRNTCVLFGDGAGAVVLTKEVRPEIVGVLGSSLGSDGNNYELLYIPGGGTKKPFSEEVLHNREQFLKMNGKEIFKLAVKVMQQACEELLKRFNITPDQLALLIPHQANVRIIDAIVDRMNLPKEKCYVNLDRYGNTTAASIPLALNEAYEKGMIKSGDYVLMVAFGAGFTWGANLIKWH